MAENSPGVQRDHDMLIGSHSSTGTSIDKSKHTIFKAVIGKPSEVLSNAHAAAGVHLGTKDQILPSCPAPDPMLPA